MPEAMLLAGPAAQLLDLAYVSSSGSEEVQRLVRHSLPVPEELSNYLQFLASGGDLSDAAADLFGEEAEVSELQRPYLGSDHALLVSSPCVAAFLVALFSEVAQKAKLELCGWDLYHGHLVFFRHCKSPSIFELGILFHAKEHPVEFTSRMGPMLEVCSPEAGGKRDPRRGTKLSIDSPGFSDRNFLWLLSLNSTFGIRFSQEKASKTTANADCDHRASAPVTSLAWQLLAPGAAGSRFFTIDESNFGLQLGSLCYLPEGHDPALPSQGKVGEAFKRTPCPDVRRDIVCIPCHAFPADWHLARELGKQPLANEMEAVRRLRDVDADLLQVLSSSDDVSLPRRKRLERLGSRGRRRRLLECAEQEYHRRREVQERELKRRQDAAVAQLVASGFHVTDVQEVLPHCDGSTVRCEAVLRVAFAKYRSSAEQAAADGLGDVNAAEAHRVLFGISPWLGGCPVLGLRALSSSEPLLVAVGRIAAEEEARFRRDSNERFDLSMAKKQVCSKAEQPQPAFS